MYKTSLKADNSSCSCFSFSGSLAGCSEGEKTYGAIRVPDTAKYVGMNDNDSGGPYALGSGQSFVINLDDAKKVYCGSRKVKYIIGSDSHDKPTKEVEVLSNSAAQVTCHGADSDYPVGRFQGLPLPAVYSAPSLTGK